MDSKKPERFTKLDGLRGLLSLIVALNHSFLVLAIPTFANVWGQNYLEFHDWQSKVQQLLMILGNGGVAVTLFFVLSGLVLGQSLQRVTPSVKGLFSFYVKRVLRLYPVYVFIITVIALYMRLGFTYQIFPGASTWYLWWMNFKMTLPEFLSNLFFIHIYLGGVTWTLRVILIASFIFPIFFYVFQKTSKTIDLFFTLVLISLSFTVFVIPDFRDLRYLYMFFLGFSLPKFKDILVNISSRFVGFTLPLVLLILFCIRYQTNEYIGGVFEAFISFYLIGILAYNQKSKIFDFFNSKVFLYLGKISYSLYLIHFSVLYILARFMFIYLPNFAYGNNYLIIHLLLFLISTPIAILFSDLVYRTVETSSLKLANFLSQKIIS